MAEPCFPAADAYVEPVEDEKTVRAFVAGQEAALTREGSGITTAMESGNGRAYKKPRMT